VALVAKSLPSLFHAYPKLVPHRINVMAQNQRGASVLIGVKELIIQLQYILGGIKRTSPVLVHSQMGHGLIRKKVRFAFEFEKSLDA
jgi:hypothetical protein